jgi:Zn-finger nucleic acid-binding protein
MQCPRCNADLVVVEAEEVELDWCAACGGVWFDAGEVEELLGAGVSLGLPPAGAAEPDLRCPRCPRRLAKTSLGSTTLDTCPDNHGIWFDAGELKALAPVATTETARTVLAHLVATFGEKGGS